MQDFSTLEIRHIDFPTLVNYWKEHNHFNNKEKIYHPIVSKLGPFTLQLESPHYQCYGLFDNNKMIGGTQLMDWDWDTVRFRTINILDTYRGRNLGLYLITKAWDMDWQSRIYLFGWMNLNYEWWAIHCGFDLLEFSRSNTHIGVKKEML